MPHASSRSLISPGSLAIRSLLLAAIASLAFLSGAPRPAEAQTLLMTLDTPNPQPGAFFGESVAVGDVNADGKADIAVAARAVALDSTRFPG